MSKRKLSKAEKLKKKRDRELYEYIFINGKQKRVRRTAEPVSEEFLLANANDIALHQMGRWDLLDIRYGHLPNPYEDDGNNGDTKGDDDKDDEKDPF